jgi:hypothetical protein
MPYSDRSSAPLCVDLDGTLIKSDLLFESLSRLLKKKPWQLLLVPFWALRKNPTAPQVLLGFGETRIRVPRSGESG